MAYPAIAFTVTGDEDRVLLRLNAVRADLAGDDAQGARRTRLAAILGRDFADNALAIAAARQGVRLTGLAGLPTLNRATSRDQYLFVNGRPVRDKLLVGAVRGAYQDFLARDRHPMVALFVDCPEDEVDVNVHPAKAEVRFRDAALVRGLIVGALRHALAAAGHRASPPVAASALAAFRPRAAPHAAGRAAAGGGGAGGGRRGAARGERRGAGRARSAARALRAGRGRRARSAGALGRDRRARPGARPRRRAGRARRRIGAQGAARGSLRHARLPRQRPRRPPPDASRDGCAAAPDGGHAPDRPRQSPPSP